MKCQAKLGMWFVVAGAALVLAGCETKTAPVATNPPVNSTDPTVTPDQPGLAIQPSSAVVTESTATPPSEPPNPEPVTLEPAAPAPAPTLPAVVPDPPATPTEVVEAEAGVAAQGRSLDDVEGVVVTPAKAYFAVREKVIFEIKVPAAYKLYRAAEEAPLTFDEFKEKVLDPNQIKLPMLPPGHTYEWDPEKEELNVRRPVK